MFALSKGVKSVGTAAPQKERFYIAINAGECYPLLKTPHSYTDYFTDALSFDDLLDAYIYIEKHGLDKLTAAIIKR